MTNSTHENIAPTDNTLSGAAAAGLVPDDGSTGNVAEIQSFPEVDSIPLRVVKNVGAHHSESDIEIGCTRLRLLTPFALARLGRPYQVWDTEKNCLVQAEGYLPLRPYVEKLAERLACGTDLIFSWVSLLCQKGPENVVAADLLKTAPSGGKGTSRLHKNEEEALQKAVYQVCVVEGIKPAGKAANKAIRTHLLKAGCISRKISTATIKTRSLSPKIAFARTDAYQRDHMLRIAGHPDEVTGLNSVLVIDNTQFTDKDNDLRVVDAMGRDLGPANATFALLKANRGIWSFRAFAGPANSFLTGLTIKRGLVSKDALLKRYNISGVWAHHGKVGEINHDCGSEFLNAQVRRAIKSRDIAVDDRSPPETPHYRGDLERFNYTAHVLFAEFLSSDFGKRYLRPVLGRPNAKGILLNDLDRALVEWIVGHYHTRGHAGLGGDSPLGRMEKFVLGKNGLPASGLPMALEDTQDLGWDFLWEETRVVNQLGLTFENRRYVNSALAGLLKLNSRSSERKIAFRFNPYAMGQVLVKIPGPDGQDVIHPIKWLPETEKYRPKAEDQQAAINPSFWEWKALFKAIRYGNTHAATAALAEALHAKREAEAAAGDAISGAPSNKERTTLSRNRDMRQTYGQENLPTTPKDIQENETATEKTTSADKPATKENPPARGRKRGKPAPRLLETAAGADAY